MQPCGHRGPVSIDVHAHMGVRVFASHVVMIFLRVHLCVAGLWTLVVLVLSGLDFVWCKTHA